MRSSSFLARLTAWQLKMRSSPFRTGDEDDEVHVTDMDYFVAAIPVAVLIAALVWSLLVPATQPPPATIFQGCFQSGQAPALLFDGKYVRPASGPSARPYRFVLQKYGTLSIDADPGLMLHRAPNGVLIFVNGRPRFANSTMTLLHEVSGKLYPVFKADDAQFLDVDADEDGTLTFNRAPLPKCGGVSPPTRAPSRDKGRDPRPSAD